MMKINDSFEFFETIDLSKYMKNGKDDDNSYTLHSVVVHQGSANSGHYYAFIRPKLEDNWILFNDETVRPADKYEVYKNNFGGLCPIYKVKQNGDIIKNLNQCEWNAYILVYIKNTHRPSILSQITDKDVKLFKFRLISTSGKDLKMIYLLRKSIIRKKCEMLKTLILF
jgi:ubiquitin carboxyl-terminal hydrolase 7